MNLIIELFKKLLFPLLAIAVHHTGSRLVTNFLYTWMGLSIGITVIAVLFLLVTYSDRKTLSDNVLKALHTMKKNRDIEYRAGYIANLIVFIGLGYTGYMNFAILYGIALLTTAVFWLLEDRTIHRYYSEILGYELVHKRQE